MIQFDIPAKTFLVGEYSALYGGPALLVTTKPCFQLNWIDTDENQNQPHLKNIHPESPAGRWWLSSQHHRGVLEWQDPYQGRGGLGASGAQFLGAYLVSCYCLQKEPQISNMLEAFRQSNTCNEGLPPSGYDVLAQSQNQCVAVHRNQSFIQTYPWHFADLDFFLVHSGKKIQTHEHLKHLQLSMSSIKTLSEIAEATQMAFSTQNSSQLIEAINAYYACLVANQLVIEDTMQSVSAFQACGHVLAAKGCGALGADVLLLITTRDDAVTFGAQLRKEHQLILATSADIYTETPLFENNPQKVLEILL